MKDMLNTSDGTEELEKISSPKINNTMYNFNIWDASYSFNPENNKDIPNFEWFMQVLSNGKWERKTFETFKEVCDSNKLALDIGGWIGPTAIWLSQHFKEVTVVEADKAALYALNKNLETSNCHNVKVIDKPIYSESGVELWFGANGFRGGSLGESTSQLRLEGKPNDSAMTTISLSDILDGMGRKDVGFIKVDIEGGEESIIPTLFEEASKIGCPIWLSFHVSWWNDTNPERFKKWFKLSSNIDTDELISTLYRSPMCDVLFRF